MVALDAKRCLRTETHLHLYGCLTSRELWQRGADLGVLQNSDDAARLDAWAETMKAAWGYRPDWRLFWTDAKQGPEYLRLAYELVSPSTFAQFEAKLRLSVALFPLAATESTNEPLDIVLSQIMTRHRTEGLRAAEYRIFTANITDAAFFDRYVTTLAISARDFESAAHGTFAPRLALSIPRDPTAAAIQYQWIRAWQSSHRDLSSLVTGIDFCGPEESCPPSTLMPLISRIVADNILAPSQRLHVLYHVGETFESRPQSEAIQWIHEIASLDRTTGTIRLGHASALGIDPAITSQSDDIIRRTQALQHNVIEWFRNEARSVVIETCPTSNSRICSDTLAPNQLPVARFAREHLPFVISSDDPGVFACTLLDEEHLCRDGVGLANVVLNDCELRANQLLKRPG